MMPRSPPIRRRRKAQENSLAIGIFVLLYADRSNQYLVSGFAAGGFGSRQQIKSNKNSTTKPGKCKAKRQRQGLVDVSEKKCPNKSLHPPQQSRLDKWGLPIATLDDIFPPLHESTELIPVSKDSYSLHEIQESLTDHLDLNLSQFFDSDAFGKVSNEDGSVVKLRLLHKSPPVVVIENFLSHSECDQIQVSVPKGHEVDSATFRGSLSTRTSTSWFCHYSDLSTLISKAHHLLNIPLETMEEPQIVRYERGQEFSWHYDEVPPSQLDNGGQRLATLLVYLTSLPENVGGGTKFRDLRQRNSSSTSELVVQPRKGTALLFFPAFADGKPDDRTLHMSEVMESDIPKWIVQIWVHQRAYTAVLPKGNSNLAARSIVDGTSHRLGYV